MNELVKYATDHGDVELSPEIIRKYLVPGDTKVSDQEVYLFLELCKAQKLNPFTREVYLVKYGNYPASIVTGKEVFTKRAMNNPMYAGLKAGITLQTKNGSIERREGSLPFPGETVVGGWASVYIKGYTVPIFDEVSLAEYSGTGALWKSKPATMIRKVAIVHALREAFPKDFEGLYSQEEINHIDTSKLPVDPVKLIDCGEANEADDAPDVYPVVDSTGQPYADAVDITPQQPQVTPVSAKQVPVSKTQGKVANGDFIIPLGKHKGSTLEHTYKEDKGWLEWFIGWDKAKDPALTIIKNYLNSQTGQIPIADDGYIPPPDDSDLPFDLSSLK